MKIFKSFSIILIFSLFIFALSNLGLSFVESSAETNSQNSVVVYQRNAKQVFSAPWNYSSITLGADIDMTGLTLMAVDSSVAQAFSGTFDGNGFSISNITFSNINTFDNSSTGSIMGLIPFAKSATIKNVKITGNVNYSLSDKNYSELNMGILVGKGIDVNISNCEVSLNNENMSEIEIHNSFANFGLIAGKLESSQIYDVVLSSPINFSLYDNLQYNFGAVVGAFTSSSIQRVLFYGDVNINGEGEFDSVYVGGLVGFAQGDCNIKDNCISSIIVSPISTKGGLIGAISANNSLPDYSINYCYWTDSSLQVVGENGDKFNQTETIKPVSTISYSFLNDKANFNPIGTGFDFKKVFGVENGKVVLQNFQKFYFSCDKNLDNIVESVNFSNGESGTTISNVDYGENITISIKLKSQNKNGIKISNVVKFYEISDIRVNGVSKNGNDYTISVDETANSFTIKFVANGYTSGEYSFSFNPKSYRGEFTIQKDGDIIPGGVTFSGANPVENIVQSYTIQSAKTNILAISQSYFVFDHWNLYYLVDGQWKIQSNWNGSSSIVNSTIANLPINFGVAPFDQAFKLEAVFSDENGVSVNFVDIDKDQVDSVALQGISFENEPITVLNTLTSASLVVTTNEGYQLDIDAFLNILQDLYQENVSKEEVLKSTTINEDGQMVYTLSVNINKIINNGTDSIDISIPTKIADNDENQNLLWLWITLPCVVIVLAISITLVIYFKKRNQAKNNVKKKQKEKEINYKDFYS